MFDFKVVSRSGRAARCGLLRCRHGEVATPVFMPVGTCGSVKGILPSQLTQIGTQIILANTYHLLLRPGPDVVEQLGGLHKFMGWNGPILTDSGGFQVFSLSSLNKINGDEVEFASHIDGSPVKLSPRIATQVQNRLGADIIMAFDQCVKLPCEKERLKSAVDRTIRWAEQSLDAHSRSDQWMFGIVQGGTDKELRSYCAEELVKLDFPGYAIGGLSVGESHDEMIATTKLTAAALPWNKPRYLMGVGTPKDLIAAVMAGIDMFDCVLPTRNGRHGLAFIRKPTEQNRNDQPENSGNGTIRLRNEKYKSQTGPLDEQCDCYTCRNFSRGFLRHLFMVNEMAGPILVSLHNLTFFHWLMSQCRDAIRQDRFESWATENLGITNS